MSEARIKVASFPDSDVLQILRSVSELIRHDITPEILRSETYISNIAAKLNGMRAPKTIKNYCSAMRQYIAFVQEKKL
ncbi:MAG: hypothetical protein U5J62_11210 [Desulfurivibrio sp.]|nr:hypothetical protein [Desulfurivibrio sp.]